MVRRSHASLLSLLVASSAAASLAGTGAASRPAFYASGDPRRNVRNLGRWQQRMTSFQPTRMRGIGSRARRRGKVSARHKG